MQKAIARLVLALGALVVVAEARAFGSTFAHARPRAHPSLDRFNVNHIATLAPTAAASGPAQVRSVLRFRHGDAPVVTSERVIADGFAEHTDPDALLVGPTGVGLGRDGVLYVADSNGNCIAAIRRALTRRSALRGGADAVSPGSTPALASHERGIYFVNDSGSGPASNSLQLLQR